MSDDWDWRFTESARQQFDSLDDYARERITSKLDEIVGRSAVRHVANNREQYVGDPTQSV